MNQITITGNLVDDPQLKFTSTGTPLCNFKIASNQGQDKEALFIDVDVWNDDITQNVAELRKGTRVTISGILKQECWQSNKTGQKNSRFKIIAQDVAVSCRWQKIEVEKIKKK
jgi:single-strand DNA-binding protein